MRTICLLLCLIFILFGWLSLKAADEENTSIPLAPIPSEARRLVLETASAFADDGFKVRDADWSFALDKAKPQFLRVTLFAELHYWFAVASPGSGMKLKIVLYDRQGHSVKGEAWQDTGTHDGSRAATGLIPKQSGEYFVGVESLDNSTDVNLDCSLVMAYK
jgi:hypothetical protein